MAQIKNYIKDTALVDNDTLLGNDSDKSGKTSLFALKDIFTYISNKSGGGTLGGVNFNLLELESYETPVDRINNYPTPTQVFANQIVLIYTPNFADVWMGLIGEGLYWTSETPVLDSDFVRITKDFTDAQKSNLNVAYTNFGAILTQDQFNDAVYANIQPDWNQLNPLNPQFIKNKPSIVAAGVKSDWNAGSGTDAEILNKPTAVSAFSNDANYATVSQVNAKENTGVASSLVTAHSSRTDNPHAVTPAQLGLATVATTGSYLSLTNQPTIPPPLAIRNQALPYTLVNADKGKVLILSNAGTLTVPTGLTGDFEVGFIAPSTGTITIAGSGVAINKPSDRALTLRTGYSQGYVVGSGTTFYLIGDLTVI